MKIGPFDFRFIEIFHELYAIEDYINTVELQLPQLIEKEKKKAYQNRPTDDPIEWQQKENELYELIEDVLPRYFRNPIIVTLWAIFESAIIEIAKEIKDQLNIPLTLDDIKGDFLKRTNKYFNHIIKFPIDVRGSSWQQFRKFYLLRNAIAHGNGRLDNIKNPDNRKAISDWEKENSGVAIMGGNIICSPDFIRQTYSIVLSFLQEFTDGVKEKYPKPKNW
jgi:hypothetical protein